MNINHATFVLFMQLTISDGKNNLPLPFHVRLNGLIESGVISKFAIISANDIRVEGFGQHKKFSLLDADEAAPNPRRIIKSPTEMLNVPVPGTSRPPDNAQSVTVATGNNSRKVRRLEKGDPWPEICHNENCPQVSDDLKMCSRCHFVG